MELSTADELLKKQLRNQLAELEKAAASRRRMLALLEKNDGKQTASRPRTRAWLLREYLERYRPEGIPIRDVPTALKEMGYLSRESQPTTNWLRQPKLHLDFFSVSDGWVKLRQDLAQVDAKYGYDLASDVGYPNAADLCPPKE